MVVFPLPVSLGLVVLDRSTITAEKTWTGVGADTAKWSAVDLDLSSAITK